MRRRRLVTTALATAATLIALTGALVAAPVGHADDGGADDLPVNYNFLLGAVTAGGYLDADPPGTNDWTCKPTAATPASGRARARHVRQPEHQLADLRPAAEEQRLLRFALTYGIPVRCPPPALRRRGRHADQRRADSRLFVDRVLTATGAAKVDLIGHSQGTLMPELLREVPRRRRSREELHLAGAALARHGRARRSGPSPRSSGSTRTTVPVLHGVRPDGHRLGVHRTDARGRGRRAGRDYMNIMTKYDELVRPYTSGIEDGMRTSSSRTCASSTSEHFEIAADRTARCTSSTPSTRPTRGR